MSMKNYALISGIVFALATIGHLWRISSGAVVTFGEAPVPMMASYIGLVIAAILAFYGLRLGTRS